MNQFKKAKQINQQNERVTDLKTAGVVETPEKTIIPEQKVAIPEKEETVKNDAVKVESPALEQVVHSDNAPEHQVENTSHSTVMSNDVPPIQPQQPAPQAENISHSTVTSNDVLLPPQEPAPQAIAAQQIPAPVIQPQYQEAAETYSEPIPTRTPKNGKKSAPNMFTQKSESKSIRKSLVLRPSSVRIAENYCAKNGGSFNELIQILLDNFIDEYGL